MAENHVARVQEPSAEEEEDSDDGPVGREAKPDEVDSDDGEEEGAGGKARELEEEEMLDDDGYPVAVDDDEEEEDAVLRGGQGGEADLSRGGMPGVHLSSHARDVTDEEFKNRCKFTPLRLTEQERRLLKVLENTLNVSEYTDEVDRFSRLSKSDRILNALVKVLSTTSGLFLSSDPQHGERSLRRKLVENGDFYASVFEIGRRYKIMNPDKMRTTYGKLMFMLQDTRNVNTEVEFVKPIQMVWVFLRDRDMLHLLDDKRVRTATMTVDGGRRQSTQQQGRRKREATAALMQEYVNERMSEEDLQRVLDSIADSNAYVAFNVEPVERMISYLTTHFDPNQAEGQFSLELRSTRSANRGRSSFGFSSLYGGSGYSSRYSGGGACLNHDHKTQFTFVFQSLVLWREIMMSMSMLWYLADKDLLSSSSYYLAHTGQGLNRMQRCPNVGDAMSSILHRAKRQVTAWVGLSVVHLGDRDVPNALVFIDKYTQVPRILSPIAKTLDSLDGMMEDQAIRQYIEAEWGNVRVLRLQIMSDFFKHGFDGSGDDGGSCIDGRLTSAWNWCSKLSKKPYYHVFMFAGFQGFDGDWKD